LFPKIVLKLLKCRNFRKNESEPEGTGVACHADEAISSHPIPHVILPDPHNGTLKRLELKEKEHTLKGKSCA
jgi:hypothetical protein